MTDTNVAKTTPSGKNVLILSASSKVRLVERFKAASVDFGAKVLVSDLAQHYAAQHFADGHIVLPSSNDTTFAASLLTAIKDHNIGLVVPTRDAELLLIAKLSTDIKAAGAVALVSPVAAIEVVQDKSLFLKAAQDASILGTPCLDPDTVSDADLPVFTRPKSGAGSVGARRINELSELGTLDRDQSLLHPFIDLPEYSVDCLFGLDGTPVQAVARSRQHITAGESKQSTIVDAPIVTRDCLEFGAALGLTGHVIFQVFWDSVGRPIFIEVNPRFGGASDASIQAGLDSVQRIMNYVFAGKTACDMTDSHISFGLTMLRYSRDVFVRSDHD